MSEPAANPPAAVERSLSVDEARAAIAAALRPITESQWLPLAMTLGRVLADDVVSPIDVPAHDNAAMDGYAFDSASLRGDEPTLLRIAGTVYAGRPCADRVDAGCCVRIMTGAVMPEGIDTVVPHELCRVVGLQLHIEPGIVHPGENRRRRGEDLQAGAAALRAGRRLKPADLGLIASLGIARVHVRRRLRVALFSTGDELRTPGEPLAPGCIYDSNRYSLLGALQRLSIDVIDLGLVPDDRAALRAALADAVAEADAVLTSGGVSMGDADHVREVLAELGQVAFWKVAMRPGRPFAFGPLRAAHGPAPIWLFALPGNPVAALVAFYVLAREALLQLAGATPQPLPALQARSATAIRKVPGRSEFQRAVVTPTGDGSWQVALTGAQGAGILSSMSQANALVALGRDQGPVAAGDLVDVWLFDGLT